MTDVSYVITVYNKAWALPRVWDSLRAQAGDFTREFVFVDDASTDESLNILRSIAARDDRVVVVQNDVNAGPAIRLNQGVRAATGHWLHLLDGDDTLPPNATQWMIAALQDRNAPLIYGCRGPESVAPIPAEAQAQLIAEPLGFAAAKPITQFALMVARDVFIEAGGSDERIFLKDQSLPLRLCKHIETMLWTDTALSFECEDERKNAEKSVDQQNHDRFFAAFNVLNTLDKDHEYSSSLRQLCASARWKYVRDSKSLPWLSKDLLVYLLSQMGVFLGDQALLDTAARFRKIDGIRRP